MKTLLIISKSDFQSTFRDPLFKALLFFPIMIVGIILWLIPYLFQEFPIVKEYSAVILMWSCIQTATLFGMVYGFLFLEEKENRILQVIQTLPINSLHLLAARLLIAVLISFGVNLFLIHYGQLVDMAWWQELLTAFHYSLMAPLYALLLGTLAQNRIEGMAQGKILNLFFLIPALIYFVPHSVTHITMLCPTYWSFRAIEFAQDSPNFLLFWAVGILYCFGAIGLINWKRRKEH